MSNINVPETLHRSAKFKNKQIAKIWGLYLEKQKSVPKMWLPEGLENTPFTSNYQNNFCLFNKNLSILETFLEFSYSGEKFTMAAILCSSSFTNPWLELHKIKTKW